MIVMSEMKLMLDVLVKLIMVQIMSVVLVDAWEL